MRGELREWRARRPPSGGGELRVDARELARMLGHLVFVSQVVPGGRPAMMSMLSSFQGMVVDWKRGRVSVGGGAWRDASVQAGFWEDLEWWEDHLETRHYTPLEATERRPAVVSGTDASGWGQGGLVWLDGQREEIQLKFTDAERAHPINWRELLGIVRVAKAWGPRLRGARLLVETDNMAAYEVGRRSRARVAAMQELVRRLVDCCELHDIELALTHTPGVKLDRPDQTSRGDAVEEPRQRLGAQLYGELAARYGPFTEFVGGERWHPQPKAPSAARVRLWLHPSHATVGSALRLMTTRLREAGEGAEGVIVVPDDQSTQWWTMTRYFSIEGRLRAGAEIQQSRIGQWCPARTRRDALILRFPRTTGSCVRRLIDEQRRGAGVLHDGAGTTTAARAARRYRDAPEPEPRSGGRRPRGGRVLGVVRGAGRMAGCDGERLVAQGGEPDPGAHGAERAAAAMRRGARLPQPGGRAPRRRRVRREGGDEARARRGDGALVYGDGARGAGVARGAVGVCGGSDGHRARWSGRGAEAVAGERARRASPAGATAAARAPPPRRGRRRLRARGPTRGAGACRDGASASGRTSSPLERHRLPRRRGGRGGRCCEMGSWSTTRTRTTSLPPGVVMGQPLERVDEAWPTPYLSEARLAGGEHARRRRSRRGGRESGGGERRGSSRRRLDPVRVLAGAGYDAAGHARGAYEQYNPEAAGQAAIRDRTDALQRSLEEMAVGRSAQKCVQSSLVCDGCDKPILPGEMMIQAGSGWAHADAGCELAGEARHQARVRAELRDRAYAAERAWAHTRARPPPGRRRATPSSRRRGRSENAYSRDRLDACQLCLEGKCGAYARQAVLRLVRERRAPRVRAAVAHGERWARCGALSAG